MIKEEFLVVMLNRTALVFQLIGVFALLIGSCNAIFVFFKKIMAHQPGFDVLRLGLGSSIVLGLEFFVGGDIIRTVITPDYYSVGILAILVVVRTILSQFLSKELAQLHAHNG